ncbi:uncharacterized protein [Argopecten irradians]|uniref:uncharacterized protein isoform X2 n=1 Tax=Argopecten irradians TaxID=31199 RepID=UPI003722A323
MASRRLPNSVQSKVINPQVCLHCGEEIADLSKVFVGKCCKNQYLCWNCHFSTTSRSFFHRSCCGQDLFRNGFQLQDLSGVLISAPPKCYSCDLEVKLEYILPGDLKICSDCFDKGMFNRSVKRTDKMQFFIGLKTNNIISSMELFPIQCVHKIVYDNRNNCQGLACVGCQELLQGNYYELECNHFACLMCCDCIVYCTICRASFNRTCPVEFRGMQHPNLFHRKVAVAEKKIRKRKKNRYGNPCTAHGKICIRITCGTSLCSDCFNEMADRRVSVIYGSGAAEEHCICICKPTKGQHIISVASLIETESQIEYLKDIAFGHCSGCYKI